MVQKPKGGYVTLLSCTEVSVFCRGALFATRKSVTCQTARRARASFLSSLAQRFRHRVPSPQAGRSSRQRMTGSCCSLLTRASHLGGPRFSPAVPPLLAGSVSLRGSSYSIGRKDSSVASPHSNREAQSVPRCCAPLLFDLLRAELCCRTQAQAILSNKTPFFKVLVFLRARARVRTPGPHHLCCSWISQPTGEWLVEFPLLSERRLSSVLALLLYLQHRQVVASQRPPAHESDKHTRTDLLETPLFAAAAKAPSQQQQQQEQQPWLSFQPSTSLIPARRSSEEELAT